MVVNENIFSSATIHLPTPHFVVLYNGINEKPDDFVYRLSDAYEVKEEEYDLELKVRVVNINAGHNPSLMEKCETLHMYAQFVDVLRKFRETYPSEQAINMAIDYCIDQDILKEYLTKNKSEVVVMVLYEFDMEKYKKMQEDTIAELENTVRQRDDVIQKQQDALQQQRVELQRLQEEIERLRRRFEG
jgi:hypothetical protein